MFAPALVLALSPILLGSPITQAVTPTATAAGVAAQPDIDPIFGGMPVPTGAYPSVVAIVTNNQLCTGTVITPTLVLTAAHCFSRAMPGDESEIYVGDTRTGTAAGRSSNWATHPEYCGAPDCGDDAYDFAYISLEEPLPVDVIPEPLLRTAEWDAHMSPGAPITFVGFGNNEMGMQTNKLFTTTTVTSFTPERLQFRAGGMGKDSCIGDSGGPAFILLNDGSYRLAGVLSAGSDPCGNGGMYGTTMAALAWLTQLQLYQAPPQTCADIVCLAGPPDMDDETGGEEDEGEEDGDTSCSLSGQGPGGAMGLGLLALLGLLRTRRH